MDSNIVSCTLSSETIHLKLDLINSSIGLLLSNIPKIRKAQSTSHKEMYTKHDPCICQANILRKETRRGQYCTLNAKSIQGFKFKTNQGRSKHKYTSTGKTQSGSERYTRVQAQTKTSQVCNFLPERVRSTSIKSSSFHQYVSILDLKLERRAMWRPSCAKWPYLQRSHFDLKLSRNEFKMCSVYLSNRANELATIQKWRNDLKLTSRNREKTNFTLHFQYKSALCLF